MRRTIHTLCLLVLAFQSTTFAYESGNYTSQEEDCNIEITDVILECEGGNLFVQISAEYADVGNEGFSIYGNGTNYGSFSYEDLPVTLGPIDADGSVDFEFLLEDNQSEACNDFVEIGPVNCNGECNIWDLSAEIFDCTSDSTYKVIIDFQHINTGNIGFDLSANGSFFGFYGYDELPLIIENFPISGGDNDFILVCDNDSNCCEDLGWVSPECNSGADCVINELIVEAHECDDNGQFLVDLDFNFENVGDEGFTVKVNGDVLGSYSYDDLFLTLGPFNDNNVYHFLVYDNEIDGCAAEFDLQAINCGSDCEIGDILTDLTDCDDEGNFYVWIDFDFAGVGNEGFSVYGNGNNYGSFDYENLPVQIGPFEGNGDFLYEILVKDNQDTECNNFTTVEALDCAVGDCEIGEIGFEYGDCNDEGNFFIWIDFDYAGVGNEGFSVFGNGNNYGSFSYDDLPVQIGPFEGNGNGGYELLVKDNQNPDCSNFIEFDALDCEGGECHIWDLSVLVFDCTSDTTYKIKVDFNYENTSGDHFDLWANGEFFGFYPYASLPLTIEEFPISGNDVDWISVCDNDNENCCAEQEFEAPDCASSDCEIGQIGFEYGDCNDEGNFFVWIDFDFAGVGNEGFSVFGNGNNYGSFSYDDLPVQIGPFEGNGSGGYELLVKDNQDPDCSNFIEFDALDCEGGECHIWDLSVLVFDCTSDTTYKIKVDFNYENTSGDHFDLWANGEFFGFYPYASLPLTIEDFPISGNEVDWISVCDNDNENCCAEQEFEAPDCATGEECHIWDLIVEAHDCDDNGQFMVDLDFNYENVGDEGFTVKVNGEVIGQYSYDELFLTLGPFDDNQNYAFTVFDNQFDGCNAEYLLEAINCGGNCEMGEIEIDMTDCDDEGNFFVWIDFDYANTGNEGFSVIGNGEDYGDFSYEDLPVLIGPFDGNGNDVYELIVKDNIYPDCSSFILVDALDCDETECEIWDLSVLVFECTSDSTYKIKVDFNFINVNGDHFDLWANGNFYGFYAYDDLPLIIEDFPVSGNDVDWISVCDNDNEACCAEQEFETPDCSNSEECHIWDLIVEAYDCDDNGQFFVDLDFNYENVGGEGFTVKVNGEVIGQFDYDSLYLTLGPFDDNQDYSFFVYDNEFDGCAAEFLLESINCGGDCEMGQIEIDLTDCDDEGNFYVWINFDYANQGNEGFSVFGNGNDYGSFSYDELPVQIGPFEGDGSNVYEIIVKDNVYPDCSSFILVDALDCEGGECEIWDLEVDVFDCTSDSTYKIIVNFNFINPTGNNFDLWANGSFFGFYAYDDLPLLIENFPISGNAVDWISVCDNDNSACCAEQEFETPDCANGEECHIWDLFVEAYDCDDNGQFLVDLGFNYEHVGSDGFTVKVNGEILGTYSYDSLYLTLGPFDDNTNYNFVVFDNEYGDCAAEFQLTAINCSGECEIGEIEMDFTDCDDEGNFYVWINFDYDNQGNEGFSVFGNGNDYGSYSYDELPVLLGPFIGDGNNVYEIVVKDNVHASCTSFALFDALDCENSGECEFWDLSVDVLECTSDSTYAIKIDFEYVNVTNDFFELSANGEYFGFYPFESLPLIIEDFPYSGNNVDWIEVCENDNSACCTAAEFEAPDCEMGEDCAIFDIIAEPTDCNDEGFYNLIIDFEFENIGSEGFKILGNGNNYGTFSYDELPVEIGSFLGDGVTDYEIAIIDNEYQDCGNEIVIEAFLCNEPGTEPIVTPFFNVVGKDFITIEISGSIDTGSGLSEVIIVGLDGKRYFSSTFEDAPKKIQVNHQGFADGMMIVFAKIGDQWEQQKIVMFK